MGVIQGAEGGGALEAACDWVKRDADLWWRLSDNNDLCKEYIKAH